VKNKRMWLAVPAVCVALVATAVQAKAQAVVNPRIVEFSPSADHSTVLPDGQAAVSDYLLEVFQAGASVPYQVVSIGKPAPDPDGLIRYDFSSQAAGWATGITYEARVAAEGPAGTGVSGLSNTFTIEVLASCSYTVAPTALSTTASGGTPTVSLTTQAGCVWTATSGLTWIAPSPSGGTDSATVTLNVAPNTAPSSRSGTVTVAGKTVTVTQAAAPPPCSYTVTPMTLSPGASASSAAVSVTAGTGCTWTASSGTSWITVSPTGGTGNGSVSLAIAANTATTSRTGTVTVAGQAVIVTQSGAAAPTCTYGVSPAAVSLPSAAAASTVVLTTQAGCAWTTSSSTGWLTVNTRSGSGSWSISFAVAANKGAKPRTAAMTVAGQAVTVRQGGRK
jgi:hypothetical protein